MDRIFETFQLAVQTSLGISPETFAKLFYTLAIIVLAVLFSILARRVIKRQTEDITRRYVARKTASYLISLFVFIGVLRVWLGGEGSLLTYLGILSAGLAIALTDPLSNLAGWLFIVIRRPFAIGDRVEVAGVAGDIIDIRLFQFSIVEIGNWVDADQSTGRIIHIPNGWIFKHSLANSTQGFTFIWNEIPVTVTFESDWLKAKQILQEIADENNPLQSKEAERQIKKASEKFLIFYHHLTPIVWTKVVDIGVTLTMRYMCDPRKRRSSESHIWEEVLERFAAEPGIDFAYPTQRFYFNPTEGKPEAGGPQGKE